MLKSTISFQLENINDAAKDFLEMNKPHQKFAFYGSMGAGKTTFIKTICEVLRAIDLVSSPTFSIINEYETETGSSIYHFDLYRIKSTDELFDIGFEEYLRDDAWCFIEWPEKAEDILADDFLKFAIQVKENGTREIMLQI
jgi:tRNA threonylcarbamoyladenosine biosynthesis protein TsaE